MGRGNAPASEHDHMSPIPGVHTVDGENSLPQAIL